MEKNEVNHSAHSTWRWQYHVVFAPKFRRKAIYGQLKADIGQILRKLCEEKKVEIIEAEACADHIHMLISIPPHLSVAQFMDFLKGKSTLMIQNQHFLLTMNNSQNYSLWDDQHTEILRIMHKGLSGGWRIEDNHGFAFEVICGLFSFCRYIEQENEFLIV